MAEHNLLGQAGEEAAARYLMFHDYSIRTRNWRVGHWEIDIVAERRGVLVFVEVKTRRNELYGKAEEAVDQEKQRLLIGAANAYMRYYGLDMQSRFDIISVIGEQAPFEIRHIQNAFRPEVHSQTGHPYIPPNIRST